MSQKCISSVLVDDGKNWSMKDKVNIIHFNDSSLTLNGRVLYYHTRSVRPNYVTWMTENYQVKWYRGDKVVFTDRKGNDFCILVYLLEKQ